MVDIIWQFSLYWSSGYFIHLEVWGNCISILYSIRECYLSVHKWTKLLSVKKTDLYKNSTIIMALISHLILVINLKSFTLEPYSHTCTSQLKTILQWPVIDNLSDSLKSKYDFICSQLLILLKTIAHVIPRAVV